MTKGLTPMQERYAQARALGEGQAEAARSAGVSERSPGSLRVWACKTERRADVKARIQALKRAAEILAADNATTTAVTHAGATEGNNALVSALPAVADLAEALGHATRVMRSNVHAQAIRPDGTVDIEALRNAPSGVLRKYRAKSRIERVPGGEKGETREVEEIAYETESTLAAAQLLVRHYDGADQPQNPGVTVNVAILQNPETRQAVAAAARQKLLEARRGR